MATIEQLIGCSADELDAMTYAQLDEHFKPMYCVTRPEVAAKRVIKHEQQIAKVNPKLAAGIELLKGLGVDPSAALMRNNNKRK